MSAPEIYYEPGTSEIYNDEFYNRYTKIQKDAKEKFNIKTESNTETIVDPVNDVLEMVDTKKESVEIKMEVNGEIIFKYVSINYRF